MYQRPVHTFSLASLGSEFVKIGQNGETRQRSNEIGFDTSSSQTYPASKLIPIFMVNFSNVHWGVVVFSSTLIYILSFHNGSYTEFSRNKHKTRYTKCIILTTDSLQRYIFIFGLQGEQNDTNFSHWYRICLNNSNGLGEAAFEINGDRNAPLLSPLNRFISCLGQNAHCSVHAEP